MKNFLPLAFLVVALACVPAKPRLQLPGNERQLVVTSRSLGADATLTAIGLRRTAKKDDGATTWQHRFADLPAVRDGGEVKRPFRFVLANLAPAARRFDVTIDYRSESGALVRGRSFRGLLVPPFTEKTYVGFTRFAPPGTAAAMMSVELVER